jgi:hypothetical protein
MKTDIHHARLLALVLLSCLTVGPLAAQETGNDPGSAAASNAEAESAGATLATAHTIYVEPMSEGFDKFLASEIRRSKNFYTVASKPEEADLWMKGVLTVVDIGHPNEPRPEDSDLAHSDDPVSGMATVVVVPRGKNTVLWQGDQRLQSVPGNHIPSMARKLVESLRKAVKEARKGSADSTKVH